jgi:cell division septum initiation protein DivIVA
MPDQSTASTEHALIQEITAPLASLPDDPIPDVADVDFPFALRGYDRLAVDAYVKRTSQLVAELQWTRSPEAAVRRALARVGEEVSGILQRAHETAEEITSQSRIEAENRLDAAREEAAQITADAHRRLKELDVETDRIWAERHRIVEDTRELARQLLALADAAVERFPPDEVDEAEVVSDVSVVEVDESEVSANGEEPGESPEASPTLPDAASPPDTRPGTADREAGGQDDVTRRLFPPATAAGDSHSKS